MLELGKDILELNIVNKFDTVLIQITWFRDSLSQKLRFLSIKGYNWWLHNAV